MSTNLFDQLIHLKVDVPEGRSGPWRVNRFSTDPNSIHMLRAKMQGRDISPGTYTRLLKDDEWQPMMSDTPAEVADHISFMYQAEGRVLVNGLGLGVVIKGLLLNPRVQAIDVVEINQDIINLVWPVYEKHKQVRLYPGNAFTIQWPPGARWDCVWHDIWPEICTDNLPEITRLKRKYARRCTWQAAWCEDRLRYMKRRGW